MIQSVRKSLELLNMISESAHPVTLTEMSATLRMNVATCSHIITTMRECGYVKRVGRREGYVLGVRAYLLGGSAEAVRHVADTIRPQMESFYNSCGEPLIFAMMLKGVRWVISGSSVNGEADIRCENDIDAFTVPTMSILLAYASDTEAETYISIHGRFTKPQKELLKNLKGADIYAPDTIRGLYHVAMPLRINGKVTAAIGSYFPSIRDSSMHRMEITEQLRETARLLAMQLE